MNEAGGWNSPLEMLAMNHLYSSVGHVVSDINKMTRVLPHLANLIHVVLSTDGEQDAGDLI